jgi:hypothetical protein
MLEYELISMMNNQKIPTRQFVSDSIRIETPPIRARYTQKNSWDGVLPGRKECKLILMMCNS